MHRRRPAREQDRVPAPQQRRLHPHSQLVANLLDTGGVRRREDGAGVEPQRGVDVTAIEGGADVLDVGRERPHQTVGPRGEAVGPENLAQTGHLGSDGHRVEIVLVEQHREVVGAEALRMGLQEQQHLRVTAGQWEPFGAAHESRAGRAQHLEARPGGLETRCLEQTQTQFGLGGRHRGPHQLQHFRHRDPRAAGDVDGAEDAAGQGIVHRGGAAAPVLDGPCEVLRGEDLDAVIDGQRRSGRVGAHPALTPVRPLGEVHRVGTILGDGVALHPQQPSRRVGDGDEQAGVRRVLDEELADDGTDEGHRMGGAIELERRGVHGVVGAAIRVDAHGAAATPRFQHDRPHRAVRSGGTLEEGLVRAGHRSGQGGRVLAGANSDPGVGHVRSSRDRASRHSTVTQLTAPTRWGPTGERRQSTSFGMSGR